MSRGPAPRGLRARIVVAFGVGGLLVSSVLAVTTYVITRDYLLGQREQSLTQQAYADAALLRNRLHTAGARLGDELGDFTTSDGAAVVVRGRDGNWYSTSLDLGADDVPPALDRLVTDGTPGSQRASGSAGPRLAVGVPIRSEGLEFFEISRLTSLQQSLQTLAVVLAAGAAAATLAGAVAGVTASRRTVRPLEDVAAAATRIAGGELSARLAPTDDPDLTGIVTSFNSMVDALGARIERDARFVADVSHELRSPLTGLVTSVEVVGAHGAELSSRGQQALGLVRTELARFRHALDDLLALARLDGGPRGELTEEVSLGVLTAEVLGVTGRSATVLEWDPAGGSQVKADKPALQRALTNLLDNADRHGGGVHCVQVAATEEWVLVHVDDAGPGVPEADRQRIFERFARGSRAARGSLPGAGLGLAIVAETAARHGGSASCSDGPAGARFTLALPRADR